MPFPGRDAIIALSYGVILVTLLGQGFTLAPLLRWLDVRETGDEERREELAARINASEAALARLEQLASEPWMHPGALSHTAIAIASARATCAATRTGCSRTDRGKSIAHLRLARELLAVERQELLRMRDNGAISDAVMRRVQQELDYEELLLASRVIPTPHDRRDQFDVRRLGAGCDGRHALVPGQHVADRERRARASRSRAQLFSGSHAERESRDETIEAGEVGMATLGSGAARRRQHPGYERRLRRSRCAARQRASSSAASRSRTSGAARRIARSSVRRSSGAASAAAARSSSRVARAGSARAPPSVTTTPST